MSASDKASALLATDRVVDRMPILRELVARLRADGVNLGSSTVVFGVQHIMDQTLALCWALNELGVAYDRIALCGKAYSTCLASARALETLGVMLQPQRSYNIRINQREELVEDIRELALRAAARKASLPNPIILVLDDGGQALTHLFGMIPPPFVAAGVEQTASGFWQTGIRTVPLSIVDVGSSAVKRLCEPPMIVDAVLQRARCALARLNKVDRVGVIGLGFIGLSLSDALQKDGYALSVFDTRHDAYYQHHAARSRDLYELINRCGVIFGATGADVTDDLSNEVPERGLSECQRMFISLSSGDDEFFSLKAMLLQSMPQLRSYRVDNIPDVEGTLWGSEFIIPRNAFPINFDNSSESVALEQIQGTICALVGALWQARCQCNRSGIALAQAQRQILDLDFQHWLLNRWLRVLPFTVQLRSRTLSQTPRRSVVKRLSTARTFPESVMAPACFGDWTSSA